LHNEKPLDRSRLEFNCVLTFVVGTLPAATIQWMETLIMKKIEAVVRRSELRRFSQCVERLGIFGFDLSECKRSLETVVSGENNNQPRLMVDFAVPDEETKGTIHAVLEQAHPDSIAIFKLGPDSTSTEDVSSGVRSNRVA
jgi:hypothetical protein